MNLTYNLKCIEALIRLKVFDFDRIAAPVLRSTAEKAVDGNPNSQYWLRKMNKPPYQLPIVKITQTASKNEV